MQLLFSELIQEIKYPLAVITTVFILKQSEECKFKWLSRSAVRLSKAQVKPICVLSVSLGNLYCMQMNFDVQVVIHLHEICGSYAMKR